MCAVLSPTPDLELMGNKLRSCLAPVAPSSSCLTLGSKHSTTSNEGKTHTMPPVVPSHTASPRTSPGPRNTVPQEHRRCSSLLPVLKPIASTQAHGQCSGPSSGPGPWPVPKPMGGTPAHGRCAKRLVSALARCQGPAHAQYAGLWSVRRPMVGTPAHGRCSGAWAVLKSMVGTQTEKPRTGAQHHARLGPTRQWRRRATRSVVGQAGVRGVWPAPHRWR